MFGMQSMIENMLEESGIDLKYIQEKALAGFQKAEQFIDQNARFQNDTIAVLNMLVKMQAVNAAKLDALLNHNGINMTVSEEDSNGNRRIEFNSDKPAGN